MTQASEEGVTGKPVTLVFDTDATFDMASTACCVRTTRLVLKPDTGNALGPIFRETFRGLSDFLGEIRPDNTWKIYMGWVEVQPAASALRVVVEVPDEETAALVKVFFG